MSGKFVVLVVAVGWLLASLVAFVVVALAGFFGIGLIGLTFWFICTRVELESDGGASLFAAQYRTQQEMTQLERASYRHAQSLAR